MGEKIRHDLEDTGEPCRIPGCDGNIHTQHGWKMPPNPRIGGGRQGHATREHYCPSCGVKYAFVRKRER